jgi:carbamoyl-phosphate synthase small subunit
MNAMLSNKSELSEDEWAKLKSYKIENAVEEVCAETNYSPGNFVNSEFRIPNSEFKVAMWDFGDGFRMSKLLVEYGFEPMTIGYATKEERILAKKPDAIMLTGGPGDPSENARIIDEIKKLCESGNNIPIFAVGLGHQMLALSQGAKTEKLKFGNRGANQPVRENMTESAFVTQQNHSYVVMQDSLPGTAVVSYSNVNDGTCEGIDYTNIPAFSVQFEPNRHIMERFRKFVINNA